MDEYEINYCIGCNKITALLNGFCFECQQIKPFKTMSDFLNKETNKNDNKEKK